MFIQILLYIFKLGLLIEITHSFKTPKHDLIFYYKTQSNVFLTNPKNHTTSYGIYVAGQTIYIDIPTSVVGVWDIVNWKVVNVDKDRLMFVHNKKAQILIDQKTIKEMKFSGELSDSIIAFGDNEALHVPTILNPDLTKPNRAWNYIELLYFNVKRESVSVIRRLPWLKDDDWKFIKEWQMTDYFHFDNKLYLLIKRSIYNEKARNVTQEISIIRLCLDKGSELISSAVEIHYARLDFHLAPVTEVIFALAHNLNRSDEPLVSFITKQPTFNQTYIVYFRSERLLPFFEKIAEECASGANNVTLLQYHLRSEIGKCKETTYESCSTKKNIVPSAYFAEWLPLLIRKKEFDKMFSFTLPYPLYYSHSLGYRIDKFNFINKHPLGLVMITKKTNETSLLGNHFPCEQYQTCTHCIMYGLSRDCIWSNSNCTLDDQPKNKTAVTVNNCLKIIDISPLMFNSSLPTTLTIELDKPLSLSQESLVIQAGHNNCTNITMNKTFIECSMSLFKSGKFKVDVSLMNDKYADVYMVRAESIDMVDIFESSRIEFESSDTLQSLTLLAVLFSGLLFSSFALIAYYKRFNKQQLNELKTYGIQSAITRVNASILSSKINTLANSTTLNEPSKKTVRKIETRITRIGSQILSSTMNSMRNSKKLNKPWK